MGKEKDERDRALRQAAKVQSQLAKRKKKVVKIKKKKWTPIYAPGFFGEQLIGESLVAEAEELMNRKLTVSLMNLTREAKKQPTSVQFQVVKLKGPGVLTSLVGYELALSATRRLVRKGRDRISDSFLVKTKDDKVARIKPFFVARGKVPNSLQTKLRLTARQVLAKEIAAHPFQKLIEDVITGKIQKLLRISVNKIYPLSSCEIRALVIEESKTPLAVDEGVRAPEPEAKPEPKPEVIDQAAEVKAQAKPEVLDQAAEVKAAQAAAEEKPKRARKPKAKAEAA